MMGFDWRKLGVAAGVCFNAVPATTVMLGPLGKEHVQKAAAKKRKVRVEEEAEEEVRVEKGNTHRALFSQL